MTSSVCASWYGAPHFKIVGGRHIMMPNVNANERKRFNTNALTLFPTRGRLARNHPTSNLLGFSAALAPKFLPLSRLGLFLMQILYFSLKQQKTCIFTIEIVNFCMENLKTFIFILNSLIYHWKTLETCIIIV